MSPCARKQKSAGWRGRGQTHYRAWVAAELVGCWAPVGLLWLVFFLLATVSTAFFTHSTWGSAHTLRPRLVINLQCKEKTDHVSPVLKALGPGAQI